METINKTKNPIIKELKENDVVMLEITSSERSSFKQICRLYNLKYSPADEEFEFDWLDFDAEVLYTNYRMHKTMVKCMGNCLSIVEIIPPGLIDIYVRQNEMWKPDMYMLSDAELQAKRRRIGLHNF